MKISTFSTMEGRKLMLLVFTLLEGVCLCLATDLTATDTTQTFSSTGYPTAYSNNQLESWVITSLNSNSRVRVDITQASIEKATGATSCSFDHISVYDGNTTSATLLAKICDSGFAYVSNGTQLLVVFDTDGSVTDIGFQATYYRTNDTNIDTSGSGGGGLTAGQIAGIVIGCILFVVIVVVVIILLICFCPKCAGVKESCLARCGRSAKVRPVREDIEVHAMPHAKKKKLPPLDTSNQHRKDPAPIQDTPKLPPIGTSVNPYHPPPFFTEGSGTWKNGPRRSWSEEGGKVPPPFNYTANPR